MNVCRTRFGVVVLMIAAGMPAGVAVADDARRADAVGVIGELRPNTLYLQSGEVDTSVERRDLGAFIGAQKGTLAGRRFVVQLDGAMRPAWRAALEGAGVVVGDYLPLNAFIVTLDKADAAGVSKLGFVRWFEEYRAEWKLAPEVGARRVTTEERMELANAGRALVVITLFAGDGAEEVVRHVTEGGGEVHWVQPIGGNLCVSATVARGAINGLAERRSVQFVEDAPELTLRNDTDRWIVQSNVPSATPLYDRGIHGEGQVLGLLDTRLDRNHCSFSDSQPIGPLHRKILAYNASAGAEFHGTHVAGTAVGDNNNATATRGIAYLGKVVFNTIPAFNETEVQNRLNTHHTQGARLHTNSWGDDGTTQYNSLCRGIDAFSYNNEDDLVLFAVTNQSQLKNPENAKNLVAVGASQDAPSQGNHCSGGTGPTTDQRRKPEIYAPGCGTNSSSAGTSCGITGATGTSMACPAVTATGMLVRQYYMDGFYPSGTRQSQDAFTPSGALIKATLLNSAIDMTGVTGYPSNQEGWGRVLADEALFFEGDARRSFVADVRNANGLSTSGLVEYPVSVLTSGERLKVTLVWTEPAASAGASFASINDLDLELVAPGGEVYKGNVFAGGQSAPAGTRDDRNNVEQVHLTAPAPGEYLVRVTGTAVNQGTQGYALTVSGDIFTPAAGVHIDLLTDLPAAVAPGTPLALQVAINPGADTLVDGSAVLHYRFGSEAFATLPLTFVEGTTYAAELPASFCGESPQFYFSAAGAESGVRTEPSGGADSPFVVAVGQASVAFNDAMETDAGWTAGVAGDSATRGVWARVSPNAGLGAPGADHSDPGTLCFVTGQESAFGGGERNDVDGGVTTLVSPRLDLSGDASAVVSYWRWYHNAAGAAPNLDSLLVEASSDDGATWATLEEVGPTGDGVVGGWMRHQAAMEGVVALTSSVRIRFVARDLGDDSNIEAGVDDFRVDAIACEGPVRCACDWNGDGGLNSQDFFDFLTSFFAGEGDFNLNGVVNSQDFFDFVSCFFKGCH